MAVSSRSSPDRSLGGFRDTISTSGALSSKHGHTRPSLHSLPMHNVNEHHGSESEEVSCDDDSDDDVSLLTGEVETLSVGDEDLEDDGVSTTIMINQAAGGNGSVCPGPGSTSRKRAHSGNGKGTRGPGGGKDNEQSHKKRNTQDRSGNDEDDQCDDDDGSDTPRGSDKAAATLVKLPCPFRVRNPLKFNTRQYASCANGYKDISTVKNHIKTTHLAEKATQNSEDGITIDTEKKLTGRGGQVKVSTWEALWGTLFPEDKEVPKPSFQVVLFADLHEFDVFLMRKILEFQRATLNDIKTKGGVMTAESQASFSEELERKCMGAFQEFGEYILNNSPTPRKHVGGGRRKRKHHEESGQSTSPPLRDILPASLAPLPRQHYGAPPMAGQVQGPPNMPPVTQAYVPAYYDNQFVANPSAPTQGNATYFDNLNNPHNYHQNP